jgi:hypothetical protein
LKSGVTDDPWRFMGIAARAVLLIPDAQLVTDIRKFVDDVCKLQRVDGADIPPGYWTVEPGSAAEKEIRRVLKIDDPNVDIAAGLNKGGWMTVLDEKAQAIVRRLTLLVTE